MINIIKKNKILISSVVIVLVLLIWFSMSKKNKPTTLLTSQSVSTTDTQKDSIVLQSLQDIKTIQLDNTLFKTPEFQSLVDFGQLIVPEPVGRINPFTPAVDFIVSTTTTFSGVPFGVNN